jgi:hypothetical protein
MMATKVVIIITAKMEISNINHTTVTPAGWATLEVIMVVATMAAAVVDIEAMIEQMATTEPEDLTIIMVKMVAGNREEIDNDEN